VIGLDENLLGHGPWDITPRYQLAGINPTELAKLYNDQIGVRRFFLLRGNWSVD